VGTASNRGLSDFLCRDPPLHAEAVAQWFKWKKIPENTCEREVTSHTSCSFSFLGILTAWLRHGKCKRRRSTQ
jgi:hypothetical protein